jgi:hypothetical protein
MNRQRDGQPANGNGQHKNPNRRLPFVSCHLFLRLGVLILLFAFDIFAQDLPGELRGYKVHKVRITVTNKIDITERDDRNQSEAYARLTEPELTDTSLTGLTFEISAEIDPLDYKGKVDFLTFHNFKVNGLDVEIEEYRNSFEFKKNEVIKLPRPVKIFLSAKQVLKGALGEATDSQDEWTVTGRVFVFGRFKKWGFDIKRVVPVEVNVKIKNPVKTGNVLPKISIPSI